MSQIRFVSLILCSLLFTNSAQAASLDCQKNNLTRLEKIICSDSELSALDKEMGGLFEAKKQNIPEKEGQLLFNEQREWLKQRESSCNIKNDAQVTGQVSIEMKTCLKKLYQARINDLKTSESDEWNNALNELANRIRAAGNKKKTDILYMRDIFPEDYKTDENYEMVSERDIGTGDEVIKAIKKLYKLTAAQVAEILEFAKYGISLYLEDVDQDGIKDVIICSGGGNGPTAEVEYLFYHVNRDKTLTKINGPDNLDNSDSIKFIHLNNKTYIAVESSYFDAFETSQPKEIIKLFSLKNKSGRKGIGEVQINYSSLIKGGLVKGNNPAFHVLEEKSDALVRYFERKDPSPLATSLMNNPAWKYDGSNAEKIDKLVGKKYYTSDFQRNDSRYQLLDIDNDGKKEVVCYLVYKTKHKYYNKMIIVKMSDSGPLSYIDVDKRYPELKHIDEKFKDYHCCNDFSGLEESGLGARMAKDQNTLLYQTAREFI